MSALTITAVLAAWLALGLCVGMLFGRWIRHADEAQRRHLRREHRR